MMHKTISQQVYDYIVQQPVGTHFNSPQLAHTLGFDVNPVSAAMHRLENKCGMLKAVGRRGRTFTYECVNHKRVHFNRRGAEKIKQHRDPGGKHPIRDLPDMNGGGELTTVHPLHVEKLSARLLRLAVALEQQRQLRKAAMKSGAAVIPPRITQPMLDRLIDIAWEIEVLERKVIELEHKVETGG